VVLRTVATATPQSSGTKKQVQAARPTADILQLLSLSYHRRRRSSKLTSKTSSNLRKTKQLAFLLLGSLAFC
jgi:hypothetical protein